MPEKTGADWYSHYMRAQARAGQLLEKIRSGDPFPPEQLVNIAHLTLIELADWRWLIKRKELIQGINPDWPFRKACIAHWLEALEDDQRPIEERMVLGEAVIWVMASITSYEDGRKCDDQEKEQVRSAISLLSDEMLKNVKLPDLFGAMRMLSHQGKADELDRLRVVTPVAKVYRRLIDYLLTNIREDAPFVYEVEEGAGTPRAAVVSAETLGYSLMLPEFKNPKQFRELRNIGREKLIHRFNDALAQKDFAGQPEFSPENWNIAVNNNWWLTIVALRWYLGDWVIFDPKWDMRIHNAQTYIANPGVINDTDSAVKLRLLAEGCLVLADSEPTPLNIHSRDLQLAVRSIIRDDQVARTLGDRLIDLLKH